MLAFAIYITHGLACYVAIDITWTDYLVKRFGSSTKKLFYEYVVRTLLVLVTCKCTHISLSVCSTTDLKWIFFFSFTSCGHPKLRIIYFVIRSVMPFCIGTGVPSSHPVIYILETDQRIGKGNYGIEKRYNYNCWTRWTCRWYIHQFIGDHCNIFRIRFLRIVI